MPGTVLSVIAAITSMNAHINVSAIISLIL